jgi:hypothetical protein
MESNLLNLLKHKIQKYNDKIQKYYAEHNIMYGGKSTMAILDNGIFKPAFSFQDSISSFVYSTGLNPAMSKEALQFTTPQNIYAILYNSPSIPGKQYIFVVNLTHNTVKLAIPYSIDTNITYDEMVPVFNRTCSSFMSLPTDPTAITSLHNDILAYLQRIISDRQKDPSAGRIVQV